MSNGGRAPWYYFLSLLIKRNSISIFSESGILFTHLISREGHAAYGGLSGDYNGEKVEKRLAVASVSMKMHRSACMKNFTSGAGFSSDVHFSKLWPRVINSLNAGELYLPSGLVRPDLNQAR